MFVSIAAALLAAASPQAARSPARPPARAAANPQINYPGFFQLARQVAPYRRTRLVSWPVFAAMARHPGVMILDARSASAFAQGHIAGAVNLPFTDFTPQSLARTIGRSDRPLLIYCNNNFRNNVAPVQLKRVELALNISTFINLVGYGYRNVHELNEVVDFNDPRIHWVRG